MKQAADFKSAVSTDFTTGACVHCGSSARKGGGRPGDGSVHDCANARVGASIHVGARVRTADEGSNPAWLGMVAGSRLEPRRPARKRHGGSGMERYFVTPRPSRFVNDEANLS